MASVASDCTIGVVVVVGLANVVVEDVVVFCSVSSAGDLSVAFGISAVSSGVNSLTVVSPVIAS